MKRNFSNQKNKPESVFYKNEAKSFYPAGAHSSCHRPADGQIFETIGSV